MTGRRQQAFQISAQHMGQFTDGILQLAFSNVSGRGFEHGDCSLQSQWLRADQDDATLPVTVKVDTAGEHAAFLRQIISRPVGDAQDIQIEQRMPNAFRQIE